jgi:DNA repair exonuclease SbcCD ATPase subunit
MMNPSMTSETPDLAETAGFLRRFADLMSTGYNATYLRHAADLLETLTARVTATSEEGDLWRFKCETATHQVELLEAECDALKHDIEGHLDVTSSVLSERDAVRATLQGRESELSELRAAHDREREALQSTLEARAEELDQLRRVLEREREDYAAKLKTREAELDQLRVSSERERAELQVQLKVRTDELAALRIVSDREQDALRVKVASLEAKRVELRSAFDRIGALRDQTNENPAAASAISGRPGLEAKASQLAAPRAELDPAVGESNAVVPKTTLRQARAQFEYLAKEFIPLGDIASQVMCALGAYTMDRALIGSQQPDHLPVGEVALRILGPSGSALPAAADGM